MVAMLIDMVLFAFRCKSENALPHVGQDPLCNANALYIWQQICYFPELFFKDDRDVMPTQSV